MSKRLKKTLTVCGCLSIPLLFLVVAFYPVVSMVRENQHRSICQSNFKQLGLAFEQYWQENDEQMPNIADPKGNRTWREATYPYVYSQRVYHCPSRQDNVDSSSFSQNYAANYSGNYGATRQDKGNGALAGPNSAPLSYSDYSEPATLILLLEAENNNRPEFNVDNAALFGPDTHKLWAGHEHGSNYLFVDGHAKYLRPLKTYQVGGTGKVLVNLWYRDSGKPLSANGLAVLKDAQERFK